MMVSFFFVPPSAFSPRFSGQFVRVLRLALVVTVIASAQSLSVVSGDGQVAPQNFQLPSPLVVMAKNASGQPVSGVKVNWSLTGPGSIIMGTQTVTDASGQTANQYVGGTIFGDTAFTQSTMTASTAG